MIESFFQSIRCPLQILLVGDPLASPWQPRGRLRIKGGMDDAVSLSKVRVRVESEGAGECYSKFMFLLDGKAVGDDDFLALDVSTFEDGLHTLRAVAYGIGLVRHQVFAERKFKVKNGKLK